MYHHVEQCLLRESPQPALEQRCGLHSEERNRRHAPRLLCVEANLERSCIRTSRLCLCRGHLPAETSPSFHWRRKRRTSSRSSGAILTGRKRTKEWRVSILGIGKHGRRRRAVRKTPLSFYKRSFYQDRLGTNVGTTQGKRGVYFAGPPCDMILGAKTMPSVVAELTKIGQYILAQ